jgi:ABC-type nitrate/sulfonate/bicarbonate transport system ATPase subunit
MPSRSSSELVVLGPTSSSGPAPAGAAAGAAVTFDRVTQIFGSGAGERLAVDDVSLHIEPGEFVSLVGPSGCGKSSLLNLVAGFALPARGHVYVDGADVVSPGADRGMVFQQHRLFPWMSVRRNVEFGLRMAGVDKKVRRTAAEEQLALVGLSDVADRPPYELSGGMQQRAAIARALAARPRVLLMDEPFSALDALTRERLQDELIGIWRRTGVTVLFVTHSVDEAVYLSSRVVLLSAHPGRLLDQREVGFSRQPDFEHSRRSEEFQAVREELSVELRTTVFEREAS